MKSYLSHLECTYCGTNISADELIRVCQKCNKVLYARYNIEDARSSFDRYQLKNRPASLWRYFELLPILDESNIVSLGEGFTHTLKAERLGQHLGINSLLIKEEGTNPTATFKARGMSVAVSKAKELGVESITLPTAGNAGGALAAYGAKAGIESYIFMPHDAPVANQKEVVTSGAHLTLVDGLIDEAGRLSRQTAATEGHFDVSTLQEPYRVEGKKTMGYEIAEYLDWKLPDAIIYPTGGGTGIVGMWKAFEEMEQMGWISSERPKMFCVQAEGCAPIVTAFQEGLEFAKSLETAHTIADGMRVPGAIGDYLILRVLRESNGGAIKVSDREMIRDMKMVHSLEGLLICPEGAATVAGLRKLLSQESLSPEDSILLLNTGSGLKYLDLL